MPDAIEACHRNNSLLGRELLACVEKVVREAGDVNVVADCKRGELRVEYGPTPKVQVSG